MSKASSSPPVSAAVRRNVMRSPLTGFSMICPAWAMTGLLDEGVKRSVNAPA
jgi:hypothetical protein